MRIFLDLKFCLQSMKLLKGLMPRSLRMDILVLANLLQFLVMQRNRYKSKKEWLLSCTFIEIYNEQVRDLLLTPGDPCPQVTIREDGQGKIILCGAKEISLSDLSAGQNKQGSLFSINQVIQLGNQNKTVGSTMANSQSSRSHSIFTFNIKYKTEDGQLISSKLNIIDLAGSERIQDTQAQGQRLKEACQINKSLSVLTEIVSQIAQQQMKKRQNVNAQVSTTHARFRDSKLTFYLKDSLQGRSFIMLIACISNEARFEQDSIKTIEFANNLRQIKANNLQKNQSIVSKAGRAQSIIDESRIRELEGIILELEQTIGQQADSYDQVQKFLNNKIDKGSEIKQMLFQLLSVNHKLNQYLKTRVAAKIGSLKYTDMIENLSKRLEGSLSLTSIFSQQNKVQQTRQKIKSKIDNLSKSIELIFQEQQQRLSKSLSLQNFNELIQNNIDSDERSFTFNSTKFSSKGLYQQSTTCHSQEESLSKVQQLPFKCLQKASVQGSSIDQSFDDLFMPLSDYLNPAPLSTKDTTGQIPQNVQTADQDIPGVGSSLMSQLNQLEIDLIQIEQDSLNQIESLTLQNQLLTTQIQDLNSQVNRLVQLLEQNRHQHEDRVEWHEKRCSALKFVSEEKIKKLKQVIKKQKETIQQQERPQIQPVHSIIQEKDSLIHKLYLDIEEYKRCQNSLTLLIHKQNLI
eukprot:403358927